MRGPSPSACAPFICAWLCFLVYCRRCNRLSSSQRGPRYRVSRHLLRCSSLSLRPIDGAVFAVFRLLLLSRKGAWAPVQRVFRYHSLLTFFIGVNLTFFPMHFLGLAVCPGVSQITRTRYGWNHVASVGSFVSFLSACFFFYIVIDLVGGAFPPCPPVPRLLNQDARLWPQPVCAQGGL